MSWVLIMTLINFGKPEVTVVYGFTSEETCRYGGAQQELVLRNDIRIDTRNKYTFVCISQ